MDINNGALNINALRGIAVIRLGMRLCKKPNKTEDEEKVVKSFLKTFWGVLVISYVFIVSLFSLTGYAMSGHSNEAKISYVESRTGRIENGQVRYVENTLFYVPQEEAGLKPGELPEGTSVSVYFDENDNVVAVRNLDELNSITKQRIILVFSVMGLMAFSLISFYLIARKTFGKPWYAWLRSVEAGAYSKNNILNREDLK